MQRSSIELCLEAGGTVSGLMLGQLVHRQLEQRVGPQAVGVIAVLGAGGDHQYAEANDLLEPVHDVLGRPRVTDAHGKVRLTCVVGATAYFR